MMVKNYCPTHGVYEYYQHRTLAQPCPKCGYGQYGGPPLTSDQYYKAMGITPKADNSHE